jgi:hypothetical protein
MHDVHVGLQDHSLQIITYLIWKLLIHLDILEYIKSNTTPASWLVSLFDIQKTWI